MENKTENVSKKQLRLPQPADDYCWELMDRASKAEGGVEALLVKVATERCLTDDNAEDLGLFRQAYQQLRDAIRYKKSEDFQRDSPEYYLFDELSCEFLKILSFNKVLKKKKAYAQASFQYHKIKDVGEDDWKHAVNTRGEALKKILERRETPQLSEAYTSMKRIKKKEIEKA